MALTRGSIHDRELHKFVESPTRPGEPAVEVSASISPGPFDAPDLTDACVRTVVGPVETFEFKTGGISGTVLKTITLTYTAPDLEELVNFTVT